MFQSTPPRGGRRSSGLIGIDLEGFNPRPRVGGDRAKHTDCSWILVSIHAPAWGATKKEPIINTYGNVSIHAPAWGATSMMLDGRSPKRFQSTPPRGGRRVEG